MFHLDSDLLDRVLLRWSANDRATDRIVPVVRAYLRYWPLKAGKEFVWRRIVEPYFAWKPRRFRARTAFGFHLEGDSDDLIQQWIYYFGVWEPALTTWMQQRLKRGDTFVDVGANIGYFALLGSTFVGSSGRVIAIEASPTTFARLRENVIVNHAENLRLVNAAAMGERSSIRLYRGNDANCGQATVVDELGGEVECVVEAFPLHELLTQAELESARLIKIDTEGAEYAIVSGFDSLHRLRADAELIIEVHPDHLARRGESVDTLLNLMARAGFTPYILAEEYWPPAYMQQTRRFDPPRRLSEPVRGVTALIFSRTVADTLP